MTQTSPGKGDMIFGKLSARTLAVAVAVLSLALFLFRIQQPSALLFDETHYVPAARTLLALTGPANVEHPLLAKILIAGSISLFGDNSFAWRLPSAVMGTVTIASIYWIALMLFRQTGLALATALLALFNQTHFIQSRIGMLDMVMTGFLLLGSALLFKAFVTPVQNRRWLMLAGVALGLAVGSKWTAIPYTGFFLTAYVFLRWQRARWRMAALPGLVLQAGLVGGVALICYFATFAPAFFYANEPMTIGRLLQYQNYMLSQQRMPLAAHPYQSNWWQWPTMQRPIWYLFEKIDDHYQAVLLLGNPLIYWGGLMSLFAGFGSWLHRRGATFPVAAAVYIFSLGIWVIIPKKIGFFYYYNLSGLWICFVIVAAFHTFDERGQKWLWLFVSASAALFAYFYPMLAAVPLPADETWTQWMWLKSWR
jgi:dolichyl-phosphate-mannose-protein mannosyltransferase